MNRNKVKYMNHPKRERLIEIYDDKNEMSRMYFCTHNIDDVECGLDIPITDCNSRCPWYETDNIEIT